MSYEQEKNLSSQTLDTHRCIDSIREELEAIDLYHQRADACSNKELKEIMLHNANEEKEHAAMLIEWLRRNNKEFGKEVLEIVGSKGPIVGNH